MPFVFCRHNAVFLTPVSVARLRSVTVTMMRTRPGVMTVPMMGTRVVRPDVNRPCVIVTVVRWRRNRSDVPVPATVNRQAQTANVNVDRAAAMPTVMLGRCALGAEKYDYRC